MTYDEQILYLMAKVGDRGLSVNLIAKHLYNLNSSLFFTPNIEDIKNVINNFTKKRMECHTLSIITRLDEDIVHDSQFDTEDYLIKHFAKSFWESRRKCIY